MISFFRWKPKKDKHREANDMIMYGVAGEYAETVGLPRIGLSPEDSGKRHIEAGNALIVIHYEAECLEFCNLSFREEH